MYNYYGIKKRHVSLEFLYSYIHLVARNLSWRFIYLCIRNNINVIGTLKNYISDKVELKFQGMQQRVRNLKLRTIICNLLNLQINDMFYPKLTRNKSSCASRNDT